MAGTEAALASPTPWVAGTQTALAVLTLEAQGQNVLPTLPPPTSAPVLMEKPTDFSPVLYGGKVYQTTFFLLLGGVSRETRLAPDMSVARFSGEVTYSLHNLTQESKYSIWGKRLKIRRPAKHIPLGQRGRWMNPASSALWMDGP